MQPQEKGAACDPIEPHTVPAPPPLPLPPTQTHDPSRNHSFKEQKTQQNLTKKDKPTPHNPKTHPLHKTNPRALARRLRGNHKGIAAASNLRAVKGLVRQSKK